jgi:flavin-dependent dehydrogenase
MNLYCRRSSATFPVGRRIAISRETFDQALVQQAVHAGAVVCEETEGSLRAPEPANTRAVDLRIGGKRVTVLAKAVLVATGLGRCPMAGGRRIVNRSRVGLGTLLECSHSEAECDALQMAVASSGYVGIAAVDGQRLDVAAAVDPWALAAAVSPGALVARIVEEAGLVDAPLRALANAVWRGTPRLTRQCRPLGTHRCLLIGDAAGYVEPFTGEGIGWAMQSAVLASELVSDQLDDWDAGLVRRWQRLHQRAVGRSQWYCRAISRLLRYESLSRLAVSSLRCAPGLARPVVRRIDRSALVSLASERTAP